MTQKIAIFVSGSGTNMENIIREIHKGRIPAQAALVVCDRFGAPAIMKAKRLGVETLLVNRRKFTAKADFEAAVIAGVEKKKIDWIVLAGFMRVLSPEFVQHFKWRIINIHPSLLPAFPGAHGIRDAFEAKVKETGVTTHFVVPEVDAGPVILQRKVLVEPTDTLDALESKIHAVEYEIYPETLRLVLSGQVKPPQ